MQFSDLKKRAAGGLNFVTLANFNLATLYGSLRHFVRDIKITHSVFALPFAASAFFLVPLEIESFGKLVWLLVAMISARSFAMGANRLIDYKIDAKNPRTKMRAIACGQLRTYEALLWIGLAGVVFVLSAFKLSYLAGVLSGFVLGLLAFYSYWKRFSFLAHYYLGFCLGLAPIAVGVALNGVLYAELVYLGIAITFWTAGFDILYALQDFDFDLDQGLHSVPQRFGLRKAIIVSRLSFFVSAAVLVWLGYRFGLGEFYYVGVVFIGCLFFYQHWSLLDGRGYYRTSHRSEQGEESQARSFGKPRDDVFERISNHSAHAKHKIGALFLKANASVSILFLLFCILDRAFTR